MDNNAIADSFSLLAKLMDIHGENSFKSKSYSIAAFNIEKLPVQLSELPAEKIFALKGIGESTGKKVIELLGTGELKQLIDIIQKTPPGVMEMLNIKGIGPKKISTIWKEMEIETIGELLYACEENRLKLYKGFGEKTQQSVAETIEFYLRSKGSFLFAQLKVMEETIHGFLQKIVGDKKFSFTGAYKRQLEIITELEVVIDDTAENIESVFNAVQDLTLVEKSNNELLYRAAQGLKFRLYSCDETPFLRQVFLRGCSVEFATIFMETFPTIDFNLCKDEADIFSQAGIAFIPSCQRETTEVIHLAQQGPLPELLQPTDIKGIIHSHSNWSDGGYTIEEMAREAISRGLEYLVISDHSKTAFYANGLDVERVKAQHQYVDELNRQLAPFKIFKSIESDILNDGSLDYSNEVLFTFDLVIASVHANLKMTEEKAMARLLKAIENPYTTILGHMTGRLLLSRKGYPIDHKAIIDACAANQVVIELNANPNRLDMDWRHIGYALEKGVLISIDPDAHSLAGFDDIRYGVWAGQKALLPKERNLSSFNLAEFEEFLLQRHQLKNI
ncbi:MAG: PHP domain-containing protein [Ferruginibacter sp.]|nr:PHP domain-containing protein [Ferruginibacter sp.]